MHYYYITNSGHCSNYLSVFKDISQRRFSSSYKKVIKRIDLYRLAERTLQEMKNQPPNEDIKISNKPVMIVTITNIFLFILSLSAFIIIIVLATKSSTESAGTFIFFFSSIGISFIPFELAKSLIFYMIFRKKKSILHYFPISSHFLKQIEE